MYSKIIKNNIQIFENYPKNPDTVLISNKFYKSLTEQDVYEYYIRNKKKILKYTNNRDVLFFIFTDLNKYIIRRMLKKNERIRLSKNNFEKIIHGRVVSIHCTVKEYENKGIIDIDTSNRNIKQTLKIAKQISNFFETKTDVIQKTEIFFTGKTSFHVHIYFVEKKIKINEIKNMLKIILESAVLTKKLDKNIITINKRRIPGKINLDLSSNKIDGNYICPFSLSSIGLVAGKIGKFTNSISIDNFKIK
jgi:hypothetical protein